MSDLQIDPKKTALVVIDLQKGIVAQTPQPHAANDVISRTRQIAEKLRAKGGVCVYVRVNMSDFLQLPVDQPMRPPNAPPPPPDASELVPEAGYQPSDILITKRHWGAFAGTDLELQLKQRGVTTVLLTGISSNIGVESTARQGTGLGFAFIIVEDACSAREESQHRWSFDQIFPRLARVRKTEDILAALA
ncbi:MAG TPA: hydrolase [Candidatus Koribacter sp.]|jgi:nicotinamidase-related amidase